MAGQEGTSGVDERTTAARPPHAIEPSELPRVGRYVVLSCLGSGAMGVVYAAHDPTLDRKVALKLLRPEVVGEPDAAATTSGRRS